MRKITAFTLSALMFAGAAAYAQTYTVLDNMTLNSTTGPYSPEYLGVFAQARDGNLYTTVQLGGASGHGVFVRLTPAGQLAVLYNFVPSTGNVPNSGLTLGTDGNLYGTTCSGGSFNNGVVFRITTGGSYQVLHNFNVNNNEGYCPQAPPVQGKDGNFYGTTTQGPNPYVGTFYKVSPNGTTFTTPYRFDVAHGQNPLALTLGIDGNFYGTSDTGGKNDAGAIFKITPGGKITLLHSFTGSQGDGSFPDGPIMQASDGQFYGTVFDGKFAYKISPGGAFNTFFTLVPLTTGLEPHAGFIQGTDGNLYTATDSLANGLGSIFSVTTGGTLKFARPFDYNTGGVGDVSLIQHTNGKFYGNTVNGGSASGGVFYKLDMGLKPFVSLLPPLSSGTVGTTIQLLGQSFTGVTAVKFNGTAARFTFVSDTYMTAAVPSGATTGLISVTTPSGTLQSNKKFRVTPQITSFTPGSGAPGTSVTITGVSLKQTTKVTFGGKAATFTVNSDTKVTAIVPSGAVTGKIVITTAGGTAQTATNFTVT